MIGKQYNKHIYLCFVLFVFSLLSSCRKDEVLQHSEKNRIEGFTPQPDSKLKGVYVLCQGNMGSNKASVDFLDYHKGTYSRNIYAERNPKVVKELGDVGNDMQIYGSKMYVVVNASHKVEVLDKNTAKRIGQIDIANCRYIAFHKGKAYVSSYVGAITLNDPTSPRGQVLQVDTASLQIDRRVEVGYQPEEMAVVGDYLYVANSGGYRAPDYDDRLSVIQLSDFKVVDHIKLGINLHRVLKDKANNLWVSSRGNYQDKASCLYMLKYNPQTGREEYAKQINVPCSSMALRGDKLLVISTEWNAQEQENKVNYYQLDTQTAKKLPTKFITDGTERSIKMPYYIAVNPQTDELYVADAKNYVSSGSVYCYSPEGKRLWSVRTGDIPASFAFLY